MGWRINYVVETTEEGYNLGAGKTDAKGKTNTLRVSAGWLVGFIYLIISIMALPFLSEPTPNPIRGVHLSDDYKLPTALFGKNEHEMYTLHEIAEVLDQPGAFDLVYKNQDKTEDISLRYATSGDENPITAEYTLTDIIYFSEHYSLETSFGNEIPKSETSFDDEDKSTAENTPHEDSRWEKKTLTLDNMTLWASDNLKNTIKEEITEWKSDRLNSLIEKDSNSHFTIKNIEENNNSYDLHYTKRNPTDQDETQLQIKLKQIGDSSFYKVNGVSPNAESINLNNVIVSLETINELIEHCSSNAINDITSSHNLNTNSTHDIGNILDEHTMQENKNEDTIVHEPTKDDETKFTNN